LINEPAATKEAGEINPAAKSGNEPNVPNLEEFPKDIHIGWITEAKDWAGELISGQRASGRILVSLFVQNKLDELQFFLKKFSNLTF